MIFIKALLTGLIGVTLCIANISGIVTDSAGVGIPGAIVKLEKGGQIDTTESNGSFVLTVASTGINSQINQAQPNRLSAIIHNGFLRVNVAEKSVVEITTFNLNGKELFCMYRTMGAGSHCIALSYRGAGIYLCKVKAGNHEFVLKGNSLGMASFGSTVSPQASSSNRVFAKHAKTAATINDVISVIKDGQLHYRQIVTNADTSGLTLKMIKSAGTVTDVDGNMYQTVRIGNQVWMAENLRVTKYNDGTPIPFVLSDTTWKTGVTPKFCYYNNTSNSDSIAKYGALYNWYAVNTGMIAPAGWHVPDTSEWSTLENYLVSNGYLSVGTTFINAIAKALAAKTDWNKSSNAGEIGCNLTLNNKSGFSGLPCVWRYSDGSFTVSGKFTYWWSATGLDALWAFNVGLEYNCSNLVPGPTRKMVGQSIRLLKN